MKLLLAFTTILFFFPTFAQTEKPKTEKPDIPGTLVVRFHNESKKMEIFESKDVIKPGEELNLEGKEFKGVEQKKAEHELDRDSSTNSYYYYYYGYGGAYSWGFNSYYYPTYYPYAPYYPYYPVASSYYCCAPTYYYGGYAYNYTPYYYYPSGPYYYYYYGYRY